MSDAAKHLLPPAERKRRGEENRQAILTFLRDERWTHIDVIQALLGHKSPQAIYRILGKMAVEGLVSKAEIPVAYNRPVAIWGITVHGLAMSWGLDEAVEPRKPFEPSKVAPTMMQHKVDLQLLKVRALRSGWASWIDGSLLGWRKSEWKVPDAVAIDPQGRKTAIEVERTVKSKKRYAEIIVSHLESKREGRWERIVYLCPTRDIAARIEREFQSITHAKYKGQVFELQDGHRASFVFLGYDQLESGEE